MMPLQQSVFSLKDLKKKKYVRILRKKICISVVNTLIKPENTFESFNA